MGRDGCTGRGKDGYRKRWVGKGDERRRGRRGDIRGRKGEGGKEGREEGVIIKAEGSRCKCVYGCRRSSSGCTKHYIIHVHCTCLLTIILLNSSLSSTTDIPEGSGVAGTLQNTERERERERVPHPLIVPVQLHAPWKCGQCGLLDISDEVLCNDLYNLWVIGHPTTWKE